MNIQEAKGKIQKILDADKDTSKGVVKEAILLVSGAEAKELSRITGLDITAEYRHVVDKRKKERPLKAFLCQRASRC